MVSNKNMDMLNEEIEKELINYQNMSENKQVKKNHFKKNHFSWGKAVFYILIIVLFFVNLIKHIAF
ncbi:hypothetical protein JL962_11715 [Staphylococcus pseudintermedius]|nr:hypothetical protein [Staphylococcus pseudintermedius]